MDIQVSPKATSALSRGDIQYLLSDRSGKSRLNLVEKLTERYAVKGQDALSAEEASIANDIFRLLLERSEVIVREMLAMNLSHLEHLPPELARQMAQDASEQVAMPVLQHSVALSDEDLLNIIQSMVSPNHMSTGRLSAIAQRNGVSEVVADALVKSDSAPVISALVRNETAHIGSTAWEVIGQRHHESSMVMEAVFQRNAVPVGIVEKIISTLSDGMRSWLEEKYGDLAELGVVQKALEQSLELTSFKLMGFESTDHELVRLLRQLDEHNRLSPFSALSMGNLQLFEVSLSRLLRIPHANVHMLLQDPVGFKTAYKQADLPESLFEATALAVRAIRSMEQDNMQLSGWKKTANALQVIGRMRRLSAGQKVRGVDQLYAMMEHCVR